ncbi:MAG: metallophosphoesterase, partial [Clostridia bacterium]|nr:metallophosphoesterase [Clostridia bacterium]
MMRKSRGSKFFAGVLAIAMLFTMLPNVFSFHTASALVGLPEGTKVGETVYEKELNTANALDGWTLEGMGAGWQWKPDGGTVTREEGGVRLSAEKGTKTIALPSIDTLNYEYTATVEVLSDGGSFGLLADMQDPVKQTTNALHALVYVGDTSNYGLYHYNRVLEMHYTQRYNNPVQLLGGAISKGDICKLSLYCIEGISYFYVNDTFISSNELYAGTEGFDAVGLYASGADILIKDVSVKKVTIEGLSYAMSFEGETVRYADGEGYTDGEGTTGLRFIATVDKTDLDYKAVVPSGTYEANSATVQFGMLLLPEDLLAENEFLNKDTPWVLDAPLTKIANQTDEEITFALSLLDIPKEDLARNFIARMYMKIRKGDTWEYVYSRTSVSRSMVGVGNKFYEDTKDEAVRSRLDKIFLGCEEYYGGTAGRVTFSLFSDFHYVEGTYMSSMADMQSILDKAKANNADFIIHAGDFCNNYSGSPELFKTYLQNNYNMPAYGIYGNHELESGGNSMQVVTPRLTNRADEVVWGTADGKIGDGSIGYYYFDVNGIRIICTDTNYSWNPTEGIWEHNHTASHNKPSG